MRFSCGALIALQDNYQRYALIGSQSHYELHGVRVLSPFGGAIETTQEGQQHLATKFKARKFESGLDLRFRMNISHLDDFRTWFNANKMLEKNPAEREFCEEVGKKEHDLLTATERNACKTIGEYKQFECTKKSSRRGQEGVETYAFFRFYKFQVPSKVLSKLVDLSEDDRNLLEFVSATEIKKGFSAKGSVIAELCSFLLK